MDNRTYELIDELSETRRLDADGFEYLVAHQDEDAASELARRAVAAREPYYGTKVFVRGLIEFSNICKNDCLYCGLRASNSSCERYRLSAEDVLSCTDAGYELGFRTFVLQSGEDGWYNDERLCALVAAIHERHPDCAITLSVGERSRESYARLREAGADRYLLRHETADPQHYARLHPQAMSFENRMRCLHDLRELGYAVGVGMMVGSPYQTPAHLAADLSFIASFKPEMCGLGPFIPHHATPFAHMAAGTLEQTCYLLSIVRLINPAILLPATTALGTIDPLGREKGMMAGANVVMPNLSPSGVRGKYLLYDGKICMGDEAAECRRCLDLRMERIGYQVVVDRGDPAV